jgi:hypothetical protein
MLVRGICPMCKAEFHASLCVKGNPKIEEPVSMLCNDCLEKRETKPTETPKQIPS